MNTPGEILSLVVWMMIAGAAVAVVAGVIRRRRVAGSAERQQAMAAVEAMERRIRRAILCRRSITLLSAWRMGVHCAF